MKSPAEIKKGLECCSEDGCKGCNYVDDCNMADGFSVLAADSLDYIMYLEGAVRNLEEVLDSVAKRAMQIVNDARWRRVHEQQDEEA